MIKKISSLEQAEHISAMQSHFPVEIPLKESLFLKG
jgi:hypothetical protein